MLSTVVHLDVCYVILQKQIDSNNVVYQRSVACLFFERTITQRSNLCLLTVAVVL